MAGLQVVNTYKPLGNDADPVIWVNEKVIPPWVIYILR
jgi:hypothetical protein